MVQWECWINCRDAVGREVKAMVALQEDGMVVVTPPGGSMRFGVEDLDQAEDYLRAVAFSVEMLRRQAQARDPHKHVPRGKRGLRGREWGGS